MNIVPETSSRVFNFSSGPAALPLPVLERARDELLELPGCGASIMEISHRSEAFSRILESAQAGIRQLLDLPENYEVLFLQGGARLQFAMIPMNLLAADSHAEFIVSGSWSEKARDEAAGLGTVRTCWTGLDGAFCQLPDPAELELDETASYAYLTSNETIQGVQFDEFPATGNLPLICDASSDLLSRPLDCQQFGLIYACAQKNVGPAGVTVVIIRKDLLERSRAELPGYLNYAEHARHGSRYNTPPTFSIYILDLVCQWIANEMGGLAGIDQLNREKAELLYDLLDEPSGFYQGHAKTSCRSRMNVTFRLPNPDLESQFIQSAAEQGLTSLAGHRSVGGIRASIYNAMPIEGVVALRDFMADFRDKQMEAT